MSGRILKVVTATVATILLLGPQVQARTIEVSVEEGRPVDVVIALDVSGSMSGLIESAK